MERLCLDGLIEIARDRSFQEIALLLDEVRRRRRPVAPSEDHPIHAAAERDDVEQVRDLLNGDATLLNRRDAGGRTPLHRAVKGSAQEVIPLLLDRGADIDATDDTGSQALDLAVWNRRAGERLRRRVALSILPDYCCHVVLPVI